MTTTLPAQARRVLRPLARIAALALLAPFVFAVPSAGTPADAAPPRGQGPHDWPMYNRDPQGTRTNPAETRLGPATVGNLRVAWRFATPAPVHGTPVVVGGVVYAGDAAGLFYALDAATGTLRWTRPVLGRVTASALVVGDVVVFGDGNGFLYGLNRHTGLDAWLPFRPDPHVSAQFWGSPTLMRDGTAVIGVSSGEELLATVPGYPCCSYRGSVFAFDPATGARRWHTYVVSEQEVAQGSSGASVWASVTYDAEDHRVYATTGNNYSPPATDDSDAVFAFDAGTGALLWQHQVRTGDWWNMSQPRSPSTDLGFGDSPQVFRLANGRKVVAAGEKGGVLYLLDAATGARLDELTVESSGPTGGLFADSAQHEGVTYANGIDWPDEPAGLGNGDVIAVRSDDVGQLSEVWRFRTPGSPNMGAVAVANGVVYVLSSRSGVLYALHAADGVVLAHVAVGVGISGPAVSRGRLYVGNGDFSGRFATPEQGGAIVALGLPN